MPNLIIEIDYKRFGDVEAIIGIAMCSVTHQICLRGSRTLMVESLFGLGIKIKGYLMMNEIRGIQGINMISQ
jgi:hypothetical protein